MKRDLEVRLMEAETFPQAGAAFEAEGIEPLLWPCDMERALRGVTHLLTSISPDDQGDPVLRDHRAASWP